MLKLDVILKKLNYELDRRLPEGKNKKMNQGERPCQKLLDYEQTLIFT